MQMKKCFTPAVGIKISWVNLYHDLPVYHGTGRAGIHNNMDIEALFN
jgi:hypothetical protein